MNKTFQWTDELVQEFFDFLPKPPYGDKKVFDFIEMFKQSRSTQQESEVDLPGMIPKYMLDEMVEVCRRGIDTIKKIREHKKQRQEHNRDCPHNEVYYGKQPPQPVKKIIEVNAHEVLTIAGVLYAMDFRVPISYSHKFPAIKQAIEQVLNEDKTEDYKSMAEEWKKLYVKLHKETDDMCRDAFSAAKEIKEGTWGNGHKYPTYEDYIKSKND